MSKLADRVRICREEAGLSQSQLARLAGTSQQAIDKIERGVTQNPRHIVEIALALDVSAAYLKGLTDVRERASTRQHVDRALKALDDDELRGVLDYIRSRGERSR